MKKISHILLAMLFVFGSAVMCGATSISTSASGSQFGDNYSYTFVITDNDILNTLVYRATLTNTSSIDSNSLIDQLAFNMNATMGKDKDFYIDSTSVDPASWSIAAPNGQGAQFDYVGNRGDPKDRLGYHEALTFDFVFCSGFVFPDNPFDLWLADGSLGAGFGGGEDFGQVAARFQQLGSDGEESDLLASNWAIPEPATMLLLGCGLIGIAVSGKKRFKKRNG